MKSRRFFTVAFLRAAAPDFPNLWEESMDRSDVPLGRAFRQFGSVETHHVGRAHGAGLEPILKLVGHATGSELGRGNVESVQRRGVARARAVVVGVVDRHLHRRQQNAVQLHTDFALGIYPLRRVAPLAVTCKNCAVMTHGSRTAQQVVDLHLR